ncbi:MAG: hypothetical protein WCB31_01360 [Nitrososphaeraceae archaeon]
MTITGTISNAFGQSLQMPEFKPKSTVGSNTITENNLSEEIALKVEFEPHENQFLADNNWYQVSDFAFAASNNSKLCPSVSCEYGLDDGEMREAFAAGERSLDGKFIVNTGESKIIFDLRANWEAVKERDVNGDLSQLIEGKLEIGIGTNPQFEYAINGTLTADDDGYILEGTGLKK